MTYIDYLRKEYADYDEKRREGVVETIKEKKWVTKDRSLEDMTRGLLIMLFTEDMRKEEATLTRKRKREVLFELSTLVNDEFLDYCSEKRAAKALSILVLKELIEKEIKSLQ